MRPSRPPDLATRVARPRDAFDRVQRGPRPPALHGHRHGAARHGGTTPFAPPFAPPCGQAFEPPLRAPARIA